MARTRRRLCESQGKYGGFPPARRVLEKLAVGSPLNGDDTAWSSSLLVGVGAESWGRIGAPPAFVFTRLIPARGRARRGSFGARPRRGTPGMRRPREAHPCRIHP